MSDDIGSLCSAPVCVTFSLFLGLRIFLPALVLLYLAVLGVCGMNMGPWVMLAFATRAMMFDVEPGALNSGSDPCCCFPLCTHSIDWQPDGQEDG